MFVGLKWVPSSKQPSTPQGLKPQPNVSPDAKDDASKDGVLNNSDGSADEGAPRDGAARDGAPARKAPVIATVSHTLDTEVAERLRHFAFRERISESAVIEFALRLLFESGDEASLGRRLRDAGAALRRRNRGPG